MLVWLALCCWLLRYNQGNLDSRWRGGGKHRWQYHFGSRGAATQTVLHLASTEVGSRLDSEDCSLMVSNSSPRQVPISRAQSAPTQCQLCQTHLTLQQPASTPSSKSLLSIRASTALRVYYFLKLLFIYYLFYYLLLSLLFILSLLFNYVFITTNYLH